MDNVALNARLIIGKTALTNTKSNGSVVWILDTHAVELLEHELVLAAIAAWCARRRSIRSSAVIR